MTSSKASGTSLDEALLGVRVLKRRLAIEEWQPNATRGSD